MPEAATGAFVRRAKNASWSALGLAVVYLLVVVVLPTLALMVAAFRKLLFIRDISSLLSPPRSSTTVRPTVLVAGRPENIDLFPAVDAQNRVTARIVERRYQGTHTIYHLDLYGVRIEALEMGTAPRHAEGGEITIALPPTLCWAYPAGG